MTNQETIDYARALLPEGWTVTIARQPDGRDELRLERVSFAVLEDVGIRRDDQSVRDEIRAAVEHSLSVAPATATPLDAVVAGLAQPVPSKRR